MSRSATSPIDPREATSIEKVLLVLLAFEERPQWSLQELSTHLALPKSSVHRLLSALTRFQFVQQDQGKNGKYYLGFRAWSLAQQGRDYEFMRVMALPVLDDLVGATGETAFLMVRSGLHALCIARADTPHGVRFLIDVGTASPLHLGASNTVLLAFLPQLERTTILDQTVHDAEERAQAERVMATIVQDGYAFSSSQLTPGAAAIGIPIFDHDDRLVAGLSIGAPAYRFTRERALTMLPALREAASRLQESLREPSWH